MSSTRTDVAVFLTEQHHGAGLAVLTSISIRRDWVGTLFRISALTSSFDVVDLVVGHWRVVREVEACALGIDQAAFLLHVAVPSTLRRALCIRWVD
jgi:hypothetical protein